MSITTEIQRLRTNVNNIRQNTSDILEAIANKGVTVPAGSNLDDCAGLISQIETGGGGDDVTIVEIGGIKYPTKQIGNKVWFLENLALEWPGLNVVNGTGYNNDTPTAYKYNFVWCCKYGYFYNYYAVVDLIQNNSSLLNGWRVPVLDDFVELVNYAGGISNCQKKLCSKLWTTTNSDNSLDFNMCPGGFFQNGTIQNASSEERYHIDSGSATDTRCFDVNTNTASLGTVYGDWKPSSHIRLCKDA